MSHVKSGEDYSEELARWLQDAARRKVQPHVETSNAESTVAPVLRAKHRRGAVVVYRLGLLVLLSAAFLQYYYAGVFLTIASMPSLIFFVPIAR